MSYKYLYVNPLFYFFKQISQNIFIWLKSSHKRICQGQYLNTSLATNYLKNAPTALYAIYKSILDMTSNGACIDKTGTPKSTTSMSSCAIYLAMVPPPPPSTFPSSPVCHKTSLLSKILLTSPIYSAEASDVSPFPPLPVYLVITTPLFIYALLALHTHFYKLGRKLH